jgi:hypothetical protein
VAVTLIDVNNKLIKFTQEINREYVRENMFSPYMGEDLTSIIRIRQELKSGGEVMNIPIVARLTGTGQSTGTLVGNEERIDNYGFRVWLDWSRHAVLTNKAEIQKDSADIFGEAKPLLSDWGKEKQRDEIIAALNALPLEGQPAGTGAGEGVRVNGIAYEQATATQLNTFLNDNYDRIVFGEKLSNQVGPGNPAAPVAANFASSLTAITIANGTLKAAVLSLLKRTAQNAFPKIRPFKTRNGYEYYVAFTGINPFRDLKLDLTTVNKDARPREQDGVDKNPIFQDGDQIWDGVIVRGIPEISAFVSNVWTSLKTAGAASARVEPVFLCGQQAATMAWGQMAKPTFRKEDDYGFVTGVGVEMAYGVGKIFKKHTRAVNPANWVGPTNLVQWGMVTGFVATTGDT